MRHASFVAVAILALHAPGDLSAQVRFERTGYRLTSIGERLAVSGRVVDARRRPVSNTNIRWRIADPTIASVTPQGVVVSRRVGYTKLWAVAGEDSTSALILVDQWVASFNFSPSILRFEAVGARTALKIQARDAQGFPINDQSRTVTACRSLNERVASLAPNGHVIARANGVTYVRCTDRGIADSVRVEVRQRPLRAAIVDKLSFGTRSVGDTFRIRIAAFDRAGDEIRDVQATWASLSPSVVVVDPLTGVARSVGPGPAKIVGQVGDVTDTLAIQVALLPGQIMPAPTGGDSAVVGPAGEGRGPALQMQSLYLAEGDEATVNIVARDAMGTPVSNPDITLRSSDTSVVAVVSGKKVAARKTGLAWVIAQFGMIVDSMQVSVRAKAATVAGGASAARAVAPFNRPKFDTISLKQQYSRRRAAYEDSSRKASVVAQYSGRMISLSAFAGQAEHSVALSGSVVEQRDGLLYGGIADAAPHRMFKFTGAARTGVLTASTDLGEDLTIIEASADLTFSPSEFLGLRGGYVLRRTETDVAEQKWTFPRASVLTRLPFVGGSVTAVMSFSILPAANYTGHVDSLGGVIKPDPFSMAGETGLEFHLGALSGAVLYEIERFTFPEYEGAKRRDQFSTIKLRLGLQRGRGR